MASKIALKGKYIALARNRGLPFRAAFPVVRDRMSHLRYAAACRISVIDHGTAVPAAKNGPEVTPSRWSRPTACICSA